MQLKHAAIGRDEALIIIICYPKGCKVPSHLGSRGKRKVTAAVARTVSFLSLVLHPVIVWSKAEGTARAGRMRGRCFVARAGRISPPSEGVGNSASPFVECRAWIETRPPKGRRRPDTTTDTAGICPYFQARIQQPSTAGSYRPSLCQ